MNTLYISIYIVIALVGIYTFFNQDKWHDSHVKWRSAVGIGSFLATLILTFFSFAPLGKTEHETKSADVMRMGDEIFVQVRGWPIQSTSEIMYLDKPLALHQTTTHNAWGLNETSRYEIVIQKP